MASLFYSGQQSGREVFHRELKRGLIQDILPSVLKKYKSREQQLGCYFVIIGGEAVERCAQLSRTAQKFLATLAGEDCDIKLVFSTPVKTQDDPRIQKTHDMRMELLGDAVAGLRARVAQMALDDGVSVDIVLDDRLLTHPVEEVRRAQVISVCVHYIEGQNHFEVPILDTTFFHNLSAPDLYKKYSRMAHTNKPIPYITKHNVRYATCNYTYYDTVRMLLDRIEYFSEKRTMFGLMKFYRYVVKFMCLYVLRKRVTTLPKDLVKVYDNVHASLMQLDLVRIRNSFRSGAMTQAVYSDEEVSKVINILHDVLHSVEVEDIIRATVKEFETRYIGAKDRTKSLTSF